MIKIIVLFGLLWFFAACKSQEPTIITIKDTVIKIAPPIIQESGKAFYFVDSVNFGDSPGKAGQKDTVLRYVKTRGKDTVIQWRYRFRDTSFSMSVKPDTVYFPYKDTTTIQTRAPTNEGGSDNYYSKFVAWGLMAIIIYILIRK